MRSLNRYGGKKRMSVRLNTSFVGEAADAAGLSAIQPEITAAHEKLHNGTGAGNAFLGWVDLPVNYDRDEFARIKSAAEKIKERFRDTYSYRYRRILPRRKSRYRVRQVAEV